MGHKEDQLNFSQWLSADRPIASRADDELGRCGFSDALADAIRGCSGRESLVLALYGEWGNGKSSLKNMTIETLGQSAPRVRCVDFNPWQLANRPSLSEAFFDELGSALDKGDLGSNHQKKLTLNKFKRWALRLQGAHDLAKSTRSIIGSLLIFFGVITIGSTWLFPRFLTILLGILTLLIGFLALTTGLVEASVKFLAAGTEVGAKGINEIKQEISTDLKKLETPILIILDDLDRLTPQEILEVFQLIKANADFPNIIYLVLCDRMIVETNITKALNVPGRDYLEKIVQVAFDVPMIDVERVRHVLFDKLNRLLAAEAVSKHFNDTRWANIFWSGLHPYFSTLRDVNRFISTLSFHISFFSVDGAFEVNPIDLIVLEVMRLNEPDFYKALQSSKGSLTANKSDLTDKKAAKQTLEAIIETGSEDHRSELTELLKHLFPATEWAFGGPSYATEFGQHWYRDLRVCSAKLFDRYFRLAVSDEELPQAAVQKLLDAHSDRTELSSLLQSLSARNLLPLAIEELVVYQDQLAGKQVEPFITAIFDVGDLLPDTPLGGFHIPIQWRVGSLIQHALEKLDRVESRAETLVLAIQNTSGLSMAIEVAELLTAESEDETKAPFLSGPQATEVRAAGLRKIENAAAAGTLAQSRRLARLLHAWRRWGGAEGVIRYTEKISSNAEGTLALLKSLELRSFAQSIGDYAGTERYYFQRNDIEPLISMDLLDERVKAIPEESLDEQGRRLVRNFQKAIERRNAGKLDNGPFDLD
ncbi:MAG TPA: P-loop NTPase fold protein [Acidobacteriaceae bacterium]|jgi:predicted KAP-like P-loop ATPase|nr:P-loop NTPase fold protein [Acidobacteriaceae bacterium]